MNQMENRENQNKITGYCVPTRLIYPKVPIEEFVPGSWGILEVDVGQILQGSFPAGFSKNGWFPTVVFKGALPPIDTEKTYYFEVEMVADAKSPYKVGFNVLFMTQKVRLTKFEEQKLFLESILTEHQIDILYEELIDPFEAIDSGDLFLLSTVKGIGEKTAEKIIETYNRTKKDANAFLVLREEFGLTDAAVTKLQQRYLSTDTIIAKLRENPYELMALDGYGFKKCDALALKGGMAKDAKFRIRAYVTHFLTEQAETEGNSWIYLRDLLHGVVEFVPSIKKEVFAEWLKEWTGRIESDEPEFLYYDEGQKRIGLKHYRELEENITEEIFRLLDAPKKNLSKCRYTIEDAIRDCEADNGWEYTDEQKAAIRGFLTNNFEIITAKAGSGKTASVGPIARFCEANGLIIAQTALSGRAASNLSEVTKIEGKTIHRLLGYSPRGGFSYDKDNQIIENVVIVDELSMNDNELLYRLLQAIPNGSKVIMLGDHSQLEPLSNGNFLKDCLDTNVVPCYRLTKIHRQAQKSAIITESIKVSNGQQIIGNSEISEIRGELKDLKIVTYKDADLSRVKFLTEYRTLLRSGVSSNDIIGVVPMKLRGAMSSFSLNNDVQKFVNPDEHLPSIKLAADKDKYYTIRLGDRVINRKNHYDTITRAIYERYGFDKDNPVEPIYNGNLGFVTDIQENYIIVNFKQQGEIVIPKAYWEDVLLGYVVTTHSFQGSQSPYVVVGLDMSAYMLLSREMLYTALTRSKKYCVLVGQINAVKKATSISRVSVKQTWLKELLLEKGGENK